MHKTSILAVTAILTACTSAPYALRDLGSFHVGGRDVEVSGKPVKEVVFTPGGVPAKVDLNGKYLVESMYVQYFLPANRRGEVPLLMAGSQFPTESYDNFVRQVVPRWTTTDDAIIAAYTALVDRVCPCVILFHSQAGQFGFKVAQARPDKVRALIAVEPAGQGDPKQADRLKRYPPLFVYGDRIAQERRWPTIRRNGVAFGEAIRAAGAKVDVVDLPGAGIRGNSHMLMMDKNNLEVAALIQGWLEKQGLYR